MKILLFGGSGQLGKALQQLPGVTWVAPSSVEVDIRSYTNVYSRIQFEKPDMVIHAAAFTDNREVEKNPDHAVHTNIIGTCTVASACICLHTRLVYISTDYVYPGDRGNYLESDPVLPFNLYAWTKLGGECAVRAVVNHLIIRTSFGKHPFPYKQAFTDKWSSKDYVGVIAPMILEASVSPLTGVLNVGTERKTLYDYAVQGVDADIDPVRIADTHFNTPYDTSLNLQKWVDHLDRPVVTPHTQCRCCGSVRLTKYLDLGLMPLSNNLSPDAKSARQATRYPLQVMLCEQCGLSQLSVVADPGKMFSYYTYRSGINQGYKDHCRTMLQDIFSRWKFGKLTHVDIAGNDGTLLKEGRRLRLNDYTPINVDPASNLTAIAEADGIESVAKFWDKHVGKAICNKYGQVHLITATNVFAHVNDIKEFLQVCKWSLDPLGILVLEFPYIIDFIEKKEFDTVYFEHLSYMSLSPIKFLCDGLGLEVVEVSRHNIHGGTLRVIIGHAGTYGQDGGVLALLDQEANGMYLQGAKYLGWDDHVHRVCVGLTNKLLAYKKAGKKIGAFAASAKGNTLLNMAGITTDLIDFIADETPEKVGKFSPGTGIPIVPKQWITRERPDVIVILSWNFAEDIKAKCLECGFTGEFVVPHAV